jgi:hypothetical protein
MTETAPQLPVTAQLGQAVGEAQFALGRLQTKVLEAAGTDFETWVTLNTIATRRASLNADELDLDPSALRSALAAGIGSSEEQIRGLLGRMTANGLIQAEGHRIILTSTGAELQGRVRAGSSASTERLIDGLDISDLERTVQCLRELTARAQAILTDLSASS